MVIGAWCWEEDGRSLRVTGCLGAHAAQLLAEQAAGRHATTAARAALAALAPALTTVGSPLAEDGGHRIPHHFRSAFATVPLRARRTAPKPARTPAPALEVAIRGADEAAPATGSTVQDDGRRVAHDVRNALTTVRLRLQLLAANPALPPAALEEAIRGVDEAAAAVTRL